MHVKRTAMLVVVGGAAAAWLYAAVTSGTRAALPPPLDRAPAIDARGEALASEVARLHERLRPTATPRQPGRNLFEFTAMRQRPTTPVAKAALSEAAAVPAPLPPPFKFIGVAEDPGPNGPARTAIVSAPGQLFLVKVGDNVTLRYRVARIAPDVLELTDLADGSTLRLALK